jgi:putative endonuclease
MFTVYIIFSPSLDKYYIGHTQNIDLRLQQHNNGLSDYTAKASDWVLKYTELFTTRYAASRREREIKTKKSRKYIEFLINSAG